MQVKILYFASLREALGCAGETVELPPGVGDVGGLRKFLQARGEAWQAPLGRGNLRFAVNQRMAGLEAPIGAGDEVAFFPPVTGG
ncbi:MAG: molybdopterin converting factor subunit 1 [Zoogloeaceae bacterium]|nr:molybdopterin converting factor subunit 1 [Zoogloeaceae bacterium]